VRQDSRGAGIAEALTNLQKETKMIERVIIAAVSSGVVGFIAGYLRAMWVADKRIPFAGHVHADCHEREAYLMAQLAAYEKPSGETSAASATA
jgi:hypothetical protein